MSVPKRSVNLVFIPFPVISHLVAAVKTAELVAARDEHLSITVLVMKVPIDTKISSYIKNSPDSKINFVEVLPEDESSLAELMRSRKKFIVGFVQSQKGTVRAALAKIIESGRLAGLVVDMFCTTMIDVANEFGVPSYIYFPSGSAVLQLLFHLQSINDDENRDVTQYEDSDFAVSVPGYFNPVPARVWPSALFVKERGFLDAVRKFRMSKGIIINTFLEFEPLAIKSLSDDEKIPPVYPVGPILQEIDRIKRKNEEIIEWLDEQPDSSVVFLCFGSNGYFEGDQVKEIAVALERSGQRFLWSLRKPPPKDLLEFPGEYENPGEVLPDGFLERILGTGKVIGWAPQMAVLSHPAVGGFVSHCGWNSTLESIWCGVPMAVWPLAAEQQANAFQLVKEFEMAVEIKMDYKRDSNVIVGAERIEKSIRELMDSENEIRVKVKALKEMSRQVMMKGESSYNFLGNLIDDVMGNIS